MGGREEKWRRKNKEENDNESKYRSDEGKEKLTNENLGGIEGKAKEVET